MNEPKGEAADRMAEAIEALKKRAEEPFAVLMDWVKRERNARDAENRCPSTANQTTEAQALTTILKVAGCE